MKVHKENVPLRHIKKLVEPHQTQLRQTIRYERYVETETVEEWVFLLGQDVSSLTHPDATLEIAERFVDFHDESQLPFSEEDQALLFTAALVHDYGELILEGEGVGDVTFEEHIAAHKEIEGSIFDRLLSVLSDSPEKALIEKSYREIAMDKTTKLGEIFNTVERIGYLETAIRAFTGVDGKRIKKWKGLVGNVLSNQIIPLLNYADKYPFVDHLLNMNSPLITDAFQATEQGNIPKDKDGKPSFDKEKLLKNLSAWEASKYSL